MRLPKPGDPRRPLALAIRSTRALGGVFLLIGAFAALPLFFARGQLGWIYPAALLVYFGPAVLYLIVAVFLKRRAHWAVVAAIVVVSIHLLFLLVALAGSAFALGSGQAALSPAFWILAALIALFVVALGQLIHHLALSFESIKYAPEDEMRGFEAIVASSPQVPRLSERTDVRQQ